MFGCDLQPKIASIPDSIGMFIEKRYPALLADPVKQPEIYNSAVTDYGVYASPELYGSEKNYVMYASVDDYVLVPKSETEIEQDIEHNIQEDYLIVPLYGGGDNTIESDDEKYITVVRGDTVYSLARKHDMTVSEFAKINDLHEPYTLSIGQKLKTRVSGQKIANVISHEKVQEIKQSVDIKPEIKPNNVKRVDLDEITVVSGDTLYSLSRKYQIPVNDLAVMNKLQSPFTLSVGQKIKVPKLDKVEKRSAVEIKPKITPATKMSGAAPKTEIPRVADKKVATENKKISSDPKKQLPKISARSSSKFSWPVRGKILSGYGAKSNGLFNDGINISANQGTPVKAAENGVVAYAGNEVKGMGNLIIIQHSDGWMSVYAHMDYMLVKRGTKVSVGQQIGRVGKTGKVDKPQLHFEIRKGTKAYNPVNYLSK